VASVRFTLRQLEYFLAAADAGSITEAAQNIPVAQSSVSAAIAQLEAALGVQLLIRHHAQGISPTAEGRQYLERARALLRNADELERFAAGLTAELSGTLHLGCLVTAVFAADHPLAGAESVTLAQLAAEPLVLLDLPHSREYFRGLFSAAGMEPEVGHRSVHPDVIRTMVANGFGYTIFNARAGTAVALDGMPLANVPITGDPRPMILGLVRLASVRPTRLVAAFEQHCRAAIASGVVPSVEPLEG
jgi:DNA-binding transcriptional LysR family regulator